MEAIDHQHLCMNRQADRFTSSRRKDRRALMIMRHWILDPRAYGHTGLPPRRLRFVNANLQEYAH
jgi:hypothetical protein